MRPCEYLRIASHANGAEMETSTRNQPDLGFLRLGQIIGDRRRGIQPLIPISASSWWAGCKSGKYPTPIKIGPNVTVWKRSSVLELLERLSAEGEKAAKAEKARARAFA